MAHFLIDASLPRATAALVASYRHMSTDVRDIGLGTALDQQIAAHARANQLILLTKDQDFGNVLDYPPNQYHGIVVVNAPPHSGRVVVLGLIEELLRRQDIVDMLPGRLAVIQPGRIRLRPPP
jgi:predicted nuclease of predicted toxin-antitoxin system